MFTWYSIYTYEKNIKLFTNDFNESYFTFYGDSFWHVCRGPPYIKTLSKRTFLLTLEINSGLFHKNFQEYEHKNLKIKTTKSVIKRGKR